MAGVTPEPVLSGEELEKTPHRRSFFQFFILKSRAAPGGVTCLQEIMRMNKGVAQLFFSFFLTVGRGLSLPTCKRAKRRRADVVGRRQPDRKHLQDVETGHGFHLSLNT